MTEADYLALTPREASNEATSELFAFYRIRSGAEVRFYPGRGTRLKFASKSIDTLDLVGVPSGFLIAGDDVTAQYKGVVVFRGSVESRVETKGRGDDETEDVTCTGPWADMQRLVYRQYWMTNGGYQLSSRLVLNQYQDGNAQNLNSELREIANHGATPCGYTVAPISVSTQYLPFDECRDITVADAIRRELRYFPKTIVRFDYSSATPQLQIVKPGSGEDAAYVATVPKTARQYTYTAHPITGVDLEIETVGDSYRTISHQRAGNTATSNPDCLYATLQLAGATGSTVTQTLDVKTEDLPASLDDVAWWKSKHPRLANVAANTIMISDATRSGAATAAQYPRIVANSAGELEAAGINCRVEQFTCKVSINHATDAEENIVLTMNFLMTNATTKEYTWVVSSTSQAGETVPTGLAAAILADRSGELRQEKLLLRLGDTLPTLGDRCDGLFLQTYSVDCCTLIADLTFGTPDYLSPEDMAALLSGFRNKRRPTTTYSRYTGKPEDDAKDKVETGSIPPLASTEWAPGKKTKVTIHAPANQNVGNFKFDAAAVDQGKTIQAKELKLNGTKVTQIVAADNVDITQKQLSAGTGISLSESNGIITISATGGGSGGTSGYTGTRTIIGDTYYDETNKQLMRQYITEVWVNGVMTSQTPGTAEYYHQAVEETV